MKMFSRRPPAPKESLVGLEEHERVLAWAAATDGSHMVATPRGLHLSKDGESRLLGWHEVTKAVWRDGRLTVIESEYVDELEIVDLPPWTAQFREPGALPVVIRQRIESSVAATRYHQLRDGGVRVVGRKIAGRDGLSWQFRADEDVDSADPTVRAQIIAVLEQERELHTIDDL